MNEGLIKLDCSNCQLLTNISSTTRVSLQELNSNNCELLTYIPLIKGLQILICSNCRCLTNIPMIEGISSLYCYNCIWLKENNKEYENNIKKLNRIQKFIRKIIMSKRLIKLIAKIMPLYYHPDCKGGYMHKKQMFIDIQSMY